MITQKKWTENLILDLVKNKVPESLTMEYKRIDALRNNNKNKNEISKDVSAFANSAGGTLIYGVVEDGHHPTEIDEGVSPDDISKEWLEQVINSRISRKIPDLLIHQIEISKPKGNVIYVIEIPQSHLAPHMASDYRYYKRYNFQSVPMEEYEVRDVGNRNVVPDLSINPVFEKNELTYNTIDYSDQFNLNLIMSNESLTPAEYHISKLYLDDRLNVSPPR